VNRHFGRIDVLVNNAGGFVQRTPLMEASDELIDRVFHLNARSQLALCRCVVPFMRAQGTGGSIINLTSQAARSGGSFLPSLEQLHTSLDSLREGLKVSDGPVDGEVGSHASSHPRLEGFVRLAAPGQPGW
jgi:NAD(P)-dependent dehydrogenase (short-subunit alcohol dehydrogenase family)